MTLLQASLLCKTSPPLPPPCSSSSSSCSSSSSSSGQRFHCHSRLRCTPQLAFNPLPASLQLKSAPRNPRFCAAPSLIRCALRPGGVEAGSESVPSGDVPPSSSDEAGVEEFDARSLGVVEDGSKVEESGDGSSGIKAKMEFGGEVSLEDGKVAGVRGSEENEGEQNGFFLEKDVVKSKIPVMVFLTGLWAMLKRGYQRVLAGDWLSWLPFWRQEKKLERLIADADANPLDSAKQSALLAELNKHRYWNR